MPTEPRAQPLTRDEFEQVVEEIAHEKVRTEDDVSPSDARAALRELDLPEDQLDEAAAKVRHRREVAAREKTKRRRRLVVVAGSLVALLVVGLAFAGWSRARAGQLAAITAEHPTLTEQQGQLRLTATLMHAPSGESVPMACTWRGAGGVVIAQSAWITKPVTHDSWETHCVLKNPSPPAHVTVEMTAHGRRVAESSR